MRIFLVSIPHTGTHFVRDHLLAEHEVLFRHMMSGQATALETLAAALPTIVPLRHPLRVARSWKRRGKDTRDLAEHWRRLVHYIDRHNPHYLPLDVLDRDRWLDKMNLKFTTSWPILRGTKPLPPFVDLSQNDIDEVAGVLIEHAAFFNRFYNPENDYVQANTTADTGNGDGRAELRTCNERRPDPV